jgi:glycosyltransferase involved in cell wall biosynthesis
LIKKPADPSGFSVIGINLDKPFQKYSLVKRRFQEIEYAKLLVAQIREFYPDVIILANTPPDAQAYVYRKLGHSGIKLIFWVQDLYGIAIKRILRKRAPILGDLVGYYYIRIERELLRQSDEVVLITGDFVELAHQWGIKPERIHVIPNWAPIEEIPVRSKSNPWAQEHRLTGQFCFLYSGTLGMKHNPDLLLQLALRFREDSQTQVVVVSEGLGADWLREKKQQLALDNLVLLGFQPFDKMPDVLGTADILVAILEPDAGVFSVPSKVLTYLCAQCPLLLAVPPENLAARIVSQNEAGLVVNPTDTEAFIKAAETLKNDTVLQQKCGENALAYAEKHFNISEIGNQFEKIVSH